MGEFVESEDRITIILGEEYWGNGYIISEDDLVIYIIRYLRMIGNTSNFLGFDELNRQVLLVNNEKYCIDGWEYIKDSSPKIILSKDNSEVIENRFKKRVRKIFEKILN